MKFTSIILLSSAALALVVANKVNILEFNGQLGLGGSAALATSNPELFDNSKDFDVKHASQDLQTPDMTIIVNADAQEIAPRAEVVKTFESQSELSGIHIGVGLGLGGGGDGDGRDKTPYKPRPLPNVNCPRLNDADQAIWDAQGDTGRVVVLPTPEDPSTGPHDSSRGPGDPSTSPHDSSRGSEQEQQELAANTNNNKKVNGDKSTNGIGIGIGVGVDLCLLGPCDEDGKPIPPPKKHPHRDGDSVEIEAKDQKVKEQQVQQSLEAAPVAPVAAAVPVDTKKVDEKGNKSTSGIGIDLCLLGPCDEDERPTPPPRHPRPPRHRHDGDSLDIDSKTHCPLPSNYRDN